MCAMVYGGPNSSVLFSCICNTLHQIHIRLYIECVEALARQLYSQHYGASSRFIHFVHCYECYTLFNILHIIRHDIIINNSHNTSNKRFVTLL